MYIVGLLFLIFCVERVFHKPAKEWRFRLLIPPLLATLVFFLDYAFGRGQALGILIIPFISAMMLLRKATDDKET